jgi:hypothetical protein
MTMPQVSGEFPILYFVCGVNIPDLVIPTEFTKMRDVARVTC